ncbi:amidase signature domain-containing protein [Phaeosphaeriaceae sp. PMI808]|nr:amidase signature domain-containing protein [Phaeosphaeriaceae sp. PMI808]
MSLLKHARQYIANQSKYAHLNAFISRIDPSSLTGCPESSQSTEHGDTKRGGVYDMPIAIKDNICTKGLPTTAASGILANFKSPYDATVVKLLQDAGAMVVGKTNMDEFGMGSNSTHSNAGPVKMQRYEGEEASAGGSSGGSALAVASAQCWVALGTDTGGSVRLPAAYTGVLGFKPSYGLLSRWGVIAYANSLDTVGIFAKSIPDTRLVFDLLNHALSAYYILAPAEASSNLAKYDGVRYGSRAEGIDGAPESVLFAKTRGKGFGLEVQRRILLGAFSLSAQAIDNYFIQAQKIRRLVQHDFNNVFARVSPLGRDGTAKKKEGQGVDVLLCPTAPTLAPSLSEVKNQDPIQAYMNDVFTVPASLAGLPAISVPIPIKSELGVAMKGEDDFKDSIGIQIIGQYGDDNLVLHAANALQQRCESPQRSAGPDMTAWGYSSFERSTVNQRKRWGDVASELGITISEAIPIGKERFWQRHNMTKEMMLKALGSEYLDQAAADRNMTRQAYITKFQMESDPLAAEKAFRETFFGTKPSTRQHRLSVLEPPGRKWAKNDGKGVSVRFVEATERVKVQVSGNEDEDQPNK